MSALKICPQCGTEYPANARFCEIDGTALRSAGGDSDMIGSIVADRYHILKKLGEGGMGQVYLAEHVKMGRKSALKVMHPGMVKDVDAISRFNREASNASRISHPNVAAVYDFGETQDGIIYLAMEFVDGPALTKVIEQTGVLPPKRAAEIVRQASDALAVAHDMEIVHRDLKPDNIMVAKTREGADLVKVVDFGIAKAAGSAAQKVTKTGLVVGTPEYMSPEQLAGDNLDGRSDIYALGLVAFNMLTGTLPFPSDSAQESMIMRLTDRPKALSEMRPEVAWPEDVQAVLDKALERDAAKRYQTATEFGRDLARAIDRMPETMAAEIGTQVLDVPPTRVPPPAPTRVSTGAPAAAATVTQTAAPPKKRNMVPAIGAAVAVAVIVAAAVSMPILRGKDSKNGPTQTDSAKGLPSSQRSGAPAAVPSAPAPVVQSALDSSVRVQQPSEPTKSDVAPPTSKTASAAPPADQLRASLDDSKNPAKAASVLSTVTRLEPQLKSSEELYLAASLRANVFTAKGTKRDTIRACSELKKVVSSLAKEQVDEVNDRIANTLSCP